MNKKLITILGPTAVGKTRLGAELAYKFNGEIISADSRQVYRGMDIGTGKDLSDYNVGETNIPYYLIDILEPTEEFNLFKFISTFHEIFSEITNRSKLPFLVGGTGLYIHSILKGYKLTPAEFDNRKIDSLNHFSIEQLKNKLIALKSIQHNTTDLEDKERIIKAIIVAESEENHKTFEPVNSLVIGVHAEREIVKTRITKRLKQRLQEGMIDEVKTLMEKGVSYDKLMFFGLEYKFVGKYLKREINYNDMFQKLNSSIHKFAKRQMTWFRKMEKEGIEIKWIEGADIKAAEKLIAKYLTDKN